MPYIHQESYEMRSPKKCHFDSITSQSLDDYSEFVHLVDIKKTLGNDFSSMPNSRFCSLILKQYGAKSHGSSQMYRGSTLAQMYFIKRVTRVTSVLGGIHDTSISSHGFWRLCRQLLLAASMPCSRKR